MKIYAVCDTLHNPKLPKSGYICGGHNRVWDGSGYLIHSHEDMVW